MIKKIILLLSAIAPLILFAQITISTQIPSSGLVPKDQLWNLILANSKEEVLDLNIKMNMQDAITGEILMTANSGNFLLGKGVKIITARDVQPVIYNYSTQDIRNYLPLGSYTVCYQAYHNGQKGEEILGEECVRINIDPLSPPMLSTPSDNATIETPYPQFSWVPPTVMELFTNLNYEILVTEISEGQSPTEAIQYNTPVYWRSDIEQNNESYPPSYAALEKNKTYAWQVIARNGQQYAVKTEVWSFKLKDDKEPVIEKSNYFLLDNNLSGTYRVNENILRVKYFSAEAAYETEVVFSDEHDKPVKMFKEKIRQGDNYFDFKISTGFQKGKKYKVTITSPAKKQQSLTFSINKN